MAAAQGPDPTVHRHRLRSELRKAREAAGLNQREVAKAMDWSLSKLIRIETGAVSITTNDLKALLNHYKITDPERAESLVDVARASRERSWWSAYRNVATQEYVAYLGYESSASIIRNFEPLLVPGLLQTEEYARAVLSVVEGPDARKVDELVQLRMERQELLVRDDPPLTHFILDEAVVRRIVGGRDVMRRQLHHIQQLTARPHVTIRIVPFSVGVYSGLRAPYVLFEFPEAEDEDILYVENPRGEMILRENAPDEDVATAPVSYLEMFWQLEQMAHRKETTAMIDDALAAVTGTVAHRPDSPNSPVETTG